MDHTHIYDLAFIAPKRRPRTPPEILFIIDANHLSELVERLHKTDSRLHAEVSDYLYNRYSRFRLPTPDLFGNIEFGYNSCGYVKVHNGKVHFHLPLRETPWLWDCTMTIHTLVRALNFPFETAGTTNQMQSLVIETLCENGRLAGYGHGIWGSVHSNLISWLHEYGRVNKQNLGYTTAAPMPDAVISAMQSTWCAVTEKRLHKYAGPRDIYGSIRDDASFSLNCFGNACDMGVYPDSVFSACEFANMGCHNLDSANQQVTLLAGLAKLCEIARDCS